MPFGSKFTSFVSGFLSKVIPSTTTTTTKLGQCQSSDSETPMEVESEESSTSTPTPITHSVPVPEGEGETDAAGGTATAGIEAYPLADAEEVFQQEELLMETDNPEFVVTEGIDDGDQADTQIPESESHFEEGLVGEAEYIASTLGGQIVEMVEGEEAEGVLIEDPNEIYEIHELHEQEEDPLATDVIGEEDYAESIQIEGSEGVPEQYENVLVGEGEEDSNMDIGMLEEQEAIVVPPENVIDETQIIETVIESTDGNGEDEDKENGDIVEGSSEPVVEIARRRLSNEGNCYCGKDRNLNIAELLCGSCHRWYHESCIGYQLGKLVPFMMNYVFICKNCSTTGLESFKRNQAQITQMCVTAIANLTQLSAKEGTNRQLFSKDRDIIPHIEMHWEGMTTARRATQSWHATVTRTLTKESSLFTIQDIPGDPNSPYFGLHDLDLTQIRPNYEAMINSGQLKLADFQNSGQPFRGRGGNKRRTVGGLELSSTSQGSVAKKSRGDTLLAKFVLGHGYPTEHPFNKDGFRYVLAEPDPNAPFRQEFDESSDGAGKVIPPFLHRVLCPSAVLLALHDRAPQLKVSENRYSVTGEKGYCTIRATHGVSKGSWYFEAKITEMPELSATRIGWGQTQCNVQAPLGFDKFGYSWRSRLGTKFHEAKGKTYCKGGYGLNDVLGFMIVLPEPDLPSISKKSILPDSLKDKPLIRFKSHLYYEEPTDGDTKDKSIMKGSKIICFKNGVCCGVAFEDIYEGTYYPSISLYKNCTVKINFGPKFECAPPASEYSYKAYNERAEEAIIEQTVADIVFLTEHHGKLRLDQ